MENNSPLVSIIMPAYNTGDYIEESILSVVHQDYRNWELIIVDDGSIDNTASVVNTYTSKYSNIKYYYQENAGQAKARNFALEKSSGDLVAFLDSDDIWLPEKLSYSVGEFMSGNQDLLFTDSYIFNNSSDLEDLSALSSMWVQDGTYVGHSAVSEFIKGNKVPMLTVMARKAPILQVGGFPNAKVAQDYGLWLKLLLNNYTLRGVSKPLSAYRIREDSITVSTKNKNKAILDLFLLLTKEYSGFIDSYRNEMKYWFVCYVNDNLTKDNLGEFSGYVDSFGLNNFSFRFIMGMKGILPFKTCRRKLRKIFK